MVTLLLLCWSFLTSAHAQTATMPWVQWTDSVEQSTQPATAEQDIQNFLASETPWLGQLLQADQNSQSEWIHQWGRSINFDEGAHAQIVSTNLLDGFLSLLGGPAREDRVVHAGIEHTYGYLFSNLKTPFGYKRARWIEGEIEQGLRLPSSFLNLDHPEAGLLKSITFVTGTLALDRRMLISVGGDLLMWRNSLSLNWNRLSETLETTSGPVTLRTDFVPLARGRYLLIYSVLDSRSDNSTRLISAFPVDEKTMRRSLDERELGTGQEIKTRYNAYVEGVSGRNWTGRRSVEMKRVEPEDPAFESHH